MLHSPQEHFLSQQAVVEIQDLIYSWSERNYHEYPWRLTSNQWHGLIAEVLLQRTRASTVVRVYEEIVTYYPEPMDLAVLSVEEIQQLISPIGLLWRASFIKALASEIASRNGEIPADYDQLVKLPGVGPYVASAWLSFHGGQRGVLIDANVVRWICRLVGEPMDGETRRKLWLRTLADRLTPDTC